MFFESDLVFGVGEGLKGDESLARLDDDEEEEEEEVEGGVEEEEEEEKLSKISMIEG